MNILIINHYAGSPEMGMEYRPYYMAKEWIKNGHNVTIIAATHSHIRTKNKKNAKKIVSENIDGINYIWIKTPKYNSNSIKRILNILTFVCRLLINAKKIAKKISPDAVIASSTYPLDIFPARKTAKKAKAKLFFEIHDLWPLSPMELGGYSPKHPYIRLLQYAEDYAYKHSDKVISILPSTLEYMKSRGMKETKWNYVPNGIVLDEWNNNIPAKKEIEDQINKIKEKGKTIVGYVGGHAISNALEYLMESIIKSENNNLFFVLIGEGTEKNKLMEKYKQSKKDNCIFFPTIPKNTIPATLKLFDILYIGWQDKELYRHGISPNKLFDYMMAAKPILHSTGSNHDLVKITNCGISVEPEAPDKILNALLKLDNMSSTEKEQMGRRGKEYVQKKHNYSYLASKFLDILK